ncbi:MAG: endonuclease/exonuclease/phosphatase family protein [Mariniphaga sp.]|nr:endonuclease/exonuclease/phosphatase family protein [Mariniphaga sp.]
MKKIFYLFLTFACIQVGAQEMNVATFNIRYNNPGDGINAWPNRIDMVTGLLKFYELDIFGLQEALYGQIQDIESDLPEFEWIGTGRDDADKKGEFSPIFYNKNLFTLIENGQFWLSETPEKPGFGWDSKFNRICTWCKFIQKKTDIEFFVLNTHFDHIADTARKNSAILINKFIAEKNQDNLPVILMGDFNLTPETYPISLIKEDFRDSREISEASPYGPVGTFNGFNHESPLERRIDYVFVTEKIKVLEYAVLSDSKKNRYPSDHLPVFVKILFK